MPVKRRRRPYKSPVRAAAADETRARILDAGRELLSAGRGQPAFSLDAVARQAGVTRLTVYNQFESKRGLLEAIFDDSARRGGLMEIPWVFEAPDVREALRRFVTLFCRFWATHAKMVPRVAAVARLDEEIGQSLKPRTERRRQVLEKLIERTPVRGDRRTLVDVLFAVTGFEVFEALSAHGRSHAAVEAIVQQLVGDALERFGGKFR